MCLVRYRPRLDRHHASFPLDRFVALLDELPDLEQVTLQGFGAPPLHPGLAARHPAPFPLDRFVALLDELPDLEQVTLQGLGEPLLHPDLAGMIRAAKDRGLTGGVNTNGTLLTGRRIDELLDSGVDWLHVSVDGATPRTF